MAIAIIGLGKWGKNLVREFSKLETVSFCVSEGNPENINWLRQHYPNITHTSDFDSILNNKTINSIVIATPIKTHYRLSLKSLKAGKHVFVEKTISDDSKKALKLLELARRKNLALFVGHIFRYHQIFEKIRIINKNEDIQFVKFDWTKLDSSSENIFLDLISHDLFLMNELFGTPKTVKLLNSTSLIDKNDIILMEIKFSKNKKCIVDVNRCFPIKRKTVTIKTKNNLFIWDDKKLYKFNNKTHLFEVHYESTKTPLEIECEEFLKTIDAPKKDFSNAKKAVKVLQILEKFRLLN